MSTPQERVQEEVKRALKAGDKERLSTFRLLLTAIQNERIRSGQEVDEAVFLALVRKAIKQRRESSDQFRQGGREELAAREEREAEILGSLLPPAADEGELESAIRELVASRGLSGPAAIGPIMKEMLPRFAGRADGAVINRIARRVLAESA